jgi:multicomponent Na+:H+ antiporter subunit E
MKHTISMMLALSVLWLLLSSHVEPLLLGLGAFSVFLTLVIAIRMDVIDQESHPFHLTFHLLQFWILLYWEIIKANIDVSLRILGLRPISPTIVTLPVPHKTDLGRVIYANSITLTPGTVSVDVRKDTVVVHALSEEGAMNLKQGYLASIVPEIERTTVP